MKFVKTLLCLTLAILSISFIGCKSEATTTFYSKNLAYELNSGGEFYSVTGIGACVDKEIIIPSILDDIPVKIISDEAFKGCN